MTRIVGALAAVMALMAQPAAAETAQDRARIARMKAAVRTPPGAEATVPKPLAGRMAELNVRGVSIAFIEDGKGKWTRAQAATMDSSAIPWPSSMDRGKGSW